jgi:hypothetical protein
MSKQEESINKAGTISRRFITCTQSTGRVGKSTVAEGLITWMRYAGIDFAAVDADSQHQSLSRRYPEDSAIFDATKTFDGFARMLNELPAFPLIIVDFPAQATDFLLSAARHFKLVEFFKQSGIRPTLLLFAADDPTAKESAAKTVRFFGDDVDYLLVENPAKFKSDEFKRTALSAWLAQRSTPTLRIPAITALTMNAWDASCECWLARCGKARPRPAKSSWRGSATKPMQSGAPLNRSSPLAGGGCWWRSSGST